MRHFFLACLLLGCAPAEPDDRAPEVLEPMLALDLATGTDDSVLVASLQDATRLADGRIALLDGDRRAVQFVAADGTPLGRVGREGAGPGEFTFPMHLGRCAADSLYVWDMGQSRVTILAPDGRFGRTVRSPVPVPFLPTCLPDGRFVMMDASKAMETPFGRDENAPLVHGALLLFSPTGDSVAAVPDQPLGRPRAIGDLAGIAVAGDEIVVGLNSSPELRHFGLDGTPLAVDSVAVEPVPFAEARYDALVERLAAATGGDSTIRARLEAMIRNEGKPPFAPLFSSMHGAADGTVWWVTSLPVDSVTSLLGHRRGHPPRHLTLPPGIEVFEVGDGYLLGKRADADGIEHLVLYTWGA